MENPLQIKRIHHVEFWVGNARQASFFYRNAFGFSQVAYRGLETGSREMASYALSQGKANFRGDHAADRHPSCRRTHQPPRRRRARHRLEVADADLAFEQALARGAEAAEAPHDLKDEFGTVRRAAIRTYGDTIHSLLSLRGYSGPFLPGYAEQRIAGDDAGILRIDHMVGNVELGQMNHWAEFYSNIFGFHRFISFDDKDISTEYSALMSIVMSDDSYSVKFPINEPAPGQRKSQIDEYLEAYRGAGVQHIALQVTDVLATVDKLQRNGVEFLRVPDSYYDTAARSRRRVRGTAGGDQASRNSGGQGRGRLPAADLHPAGGGSSDGVLRDHPAQGQPRLRQGKLQGAV